MSSLMKKRRIKKRSPATESYESHFELSALFEFSKIINASLDQRFILSHILLTIMGKTVSSKGMIVLGTGRERFSVEMVKGFSTDLVGMRLEVDRIPSAMFYVEKLNAARYPWVKFFKKVGVKILLPMFIADKAVGLLGFGEPYSRKRLKKREQTYLRSLANISASAIEKSRTLNEVQQVNRKLDRKIQEMNTLFELGKEFNSLLDPEKIVRVLVFSLLGQLGVNRYLICLWDGLDMNVVASRLEGPVPHRELLRLLAKVRTATTIPEMAVKQAVDPRASLTNAGLSVVVPMQIQGQSRGVVLLGEKLNREPFNALDLEFLTSLTNLAIISLENARLFRETIEKQKLEDELLIAREIQKGLLPSILPAIPGIEVAATNISSRQVGGDYYDVLQTDSDRYLIAIGDVSGKGYPAALLMANLQATIRALVPLHLTLSELTARVNDLMCENTGGDKFVTFFWGCVTNGGRSIRYVNAGHNYPYLLRSDGSLERLDKGGMILGVMKTSTPYEEETLHLNPGDILILYTDGVSEAMSRDTVEYGESRLESAIRTAQKKNAQGIIDGIHADIRDFVRGAAQSDDITMMVLKAV